ncbi:MAG: ribosomal subunit interface protein [Phycisphaerae bacterium]|nr:ribosomal subunit interface protein [Phycisphaerae bacterium]|tara:strand:+ start:165 stop:470 length:306 start_codon:yes stop_codon:yes gene_type:complete
MRIDVTGKGYDVPDRVRTHAEAKGEKLLKFFDRTQQIIFKIEKHEKSGFAVELIVDVEKHDDFIATSAHDDVIAAIDEVTQKASRQLTDFKEKLKTGNRSH